MIIGTHATDPAEITARARAAERVATMLATSGTAAALAKQLQCGQADAIGDLMLACGREHDARIWISEHVADDDPGDFHNAGIYGLAAAEFDSADAYARYWVNRRTLTGAPEPARD